MCETGEHTNKSPLGTIIDVLLASNTTYVELSDQGKLLDCMSSYTKCTACAVLSASVGSVRRLQYLRTSKSTSTKATGFETWSDRR